MRKRVSDTAKWGDVTSGPRVVDASAKAKMKEVLNDIQSGKFAKEWVAEHEAGRPKYTELLSADDNHPIEKVGAQLRSMMSWIQEKESAATK